MLHKTFDVTSTATVTVSLGICTELDGKQNGFGEYLPGDIKHDCACALVWDFWLLPGWVLLLLAPKTSMICQAVANNFNMGSKQGNLKITACVVIHMFYIWNHHNMVWIPGPSGIPGYPGIPGLNSNPDPGMLENKIPGFFGIYHIKQINEFKDFY